MLIIMTNTPTPSLARWPFLTHIKYLARDYVGIVQNSDQNFVHMYVIEHSWSPDQKVEFMSCGELYWWGSNRQIPINVFMGARFKPYSVYLKSFSQKEVKLVYGPMPSLDTLINKRSKKRTVQLVKGTPTH
jgi:hypothetical protein